MGQGAKQVTAVFRILVTAAALTGAQVAAANCVNLEGQFRQGGLVWGNVAPGSTVTLNGKPLDVLEDGTTIAGFGRDAALAATLLAGFAVTLAPWTAWIATAATPPTVRSTASPARGRFLPRPGAW